MKIAIYDIIHLEQVIPLVKVAIYGRHHVHFFTNESFREEVEQIASAARDRITFSYWNGNISEYRFFIRVVRTMSRNKFDVFILNSVDSKHICWFLLCAIFPKTKSILNIHDVNNLFRSVFRWNIKGIVRHFGKKWLISRMDGFIVNTEPMKDYVVNNRYTQKPVWWYPPVVYDGQSQNPPDTLPLKVIIPGSIDGRRRNYEEALSVYHRLIQETQTPLQLILAGQPYASYGLVVISRARQINNAGGQITFFHAEIPEHEFRELFEGAHLIWSPLVHETSIFDGIPEIYGETKNSGNTHDAIRFARPMLLPSGIKSAKELRTGIVSYSSPEVCLDQLKRFSTDRTWRSNLLAEAQKNAGSFTVDKVSNIFEMILTELGNPTETATSTH